VRNTRFFNKPDLVEARHTGIISGPLVVVFIIELLRLLKELLRNVYRFLVGLFMYIFEANS